MIKIIIIDREYAAERRISPPHLRRGLVGDCGTSYLPLGHDFFGGLRLKKQSTGCAAMGKSEEEANLLACGEPRFFRLRQESTAARRLHTGKDN
jgi:hypothetical protein